MKKIIVQLAVLLLPFAIGAVYLRGMEWLVSLPGSIPLLGRAVLKMALTGIGAAQILLWVRLGIWHRKGNSPFLPALLAANSIYFLLCLAVGFGVLNGGMPWTEALHSLMECYCVGLFSLKLYSVMPVILEVSSHILTSWAAVSAVLRGVFLFWLGYYWENIWGRQ